VKSCTIGGNVAENAGGPHTLATASPTNHVTALELVLPGAKSFASAPARRHAWLRSHRPLRRLGARSPWSLKSRLGFAQARSRENASRHLRFRRRCRRHRRRHHRPRHHSRRGVKCSTAWTLRASRLYPPGFPMDSAGCLLIEVESLTENRRYSGHRDHRSLQRASCPEVRVARDNAERDLLWKAARRFRPRRPLGPQQITSLTRHPAFETSASSAPHPANRRSIRLSDRQHLPRRRRQPASHRTSTIPRRRAIPARPESLRRNHPLLRRSRRRAYGGHGEHGCDFALLSPTPTYDLMRAASIELSLTDERDGIVRLVARASRVALVETTCRESLPDAMLRSLACPWPEIAP